MEYRRAKLASDDYEGPIHLSPLRLRTPRYKDAFGSYPKKRIPWQYNAKLNITPNKILSSRRLAPRVQIQPISMENSARDFRNPNKVNRIPDPLPFSSISQQWQPISASNQDLLHELNMSQSSKIRERRGTDSFSPEGPRFPQLNNSSLDAHSFQTRDSNLDEAYRLISPSALIYPRKMQDVRKKAERLYVQRMSNRDKSNKVSF